MPLPVDSLNEKSKLDEIREAISSSIEQLINEGRDKAQAAAIAYSQAERKTKRNIP